jgi:hypothetical protein
MGLGTVLKTHREVVKELERRNIDHSRSDPIDFASPHPSISLPVVRSSVDRVRGVVYGVVLEPDVPDRDGHSASAEEIEKAAHAFMKTTRPVWIRHAKKVVKASIVENYVMPTDVVFEDSEYGRQIVRKGTWVVGVLVEDPHVRELIQRGKLVGLSLRSLATLTS